MSEEQIYNELNEVFRELFDDDSIVVKPETTSQDIDGWDSLEHINLIVAVERKFGIKFTMGEVTTMKNVGEMVEIIAKRRGM